MSGRRRTGALATGLNTLTTLVGSKFEAGQKEEAAQKDFQRRLVEAGVKQGLESGQIQPQFQGGQFSGFAQPQAAAMPTAPNALAEAPADPRQQKKVTTRFDKYGKPQGYNVSEETAKPKPLREGMDKYLANLQNSLYLSEKLEADARGNAQIPFGQVMGGLSNPMYSRSGLTGMVGSMQRGHADPAISDFAQRYFRGQDQYRREVTGAAAPLPEITQFIPAALPDPGTQKRENFLSASDSFQADIQQALTFAKQRLLAQGYPEWQIDELFSSASPAPTTPPAGAGNTIGRFQVEVE